jgi:hypothetical protein
MKFWRDHSLTIVLGQSGQRGQPRSVSSTRRSKPMPSKTPKQKRTMAAAAHDPKFARKIGIPTRVAKEFNAADQRVKKTGKRKS